jgi:hypothetical protein
MAAIEGMRQLLGESVDLAWVEMLASNTSIVDQMENLNFRVFETEYLFKGEPTTAALRHFEPTSACFKLSTGQLAWKGIPRAPWHNFAEQVAEFKKSFGLVQTDLICLSARVASLLDNPE